jgi:signal transduction histidine kinase/CheY-like chemotaxis protein
MTAPRPDLHPAREGDGFRTERLLASLDEGLWEHDLVTGRSWTSRRFRHLLGFAGDPWPADASVLRPRVHPDDLPAFDALHARTCAQGGTTDPHHLRLLCRDGRWRWFRLRLRAWPDADGRPRHLVGTLQDAEVEVRATTDLRRVTQRFERVIAAAEEGLFEGVWDIDEVQLSDRAREIVGLPPERLVIGYRDLRARLHPDDLPTVRAAISAAAASGGRWEVTYRARRFDAAEGGDDDWRWIRERGTAASEPDAPPRVQGLIADITDQVTETGRLETRVARRTAELAEALRLAEDRRQAAEAANRAKASFLAQMSHELRTPLGGVLGMLALAQRKPASTEQARFLEMAARSARSMLHVVEDLLDFARAEAGRLTLDEQPFDIATALAETFAAFMPAARERGVEMLFDVIGGPLRLHGDASRIQQMVSNLVGNATKFTEHGHIALVVETTLRTDAADSPAADVRLTVSDTGPGMDDATARRVFEPFEQGDATMGRRHGGAGLGLSIVRMLADRMGGRVSVETRLGEGSTFRIDLVLPIAAPVDRPMPVQPAGTVWVIDDRPTSAAGLAPRFERLGWTPVVHADLSAAVDAAQDLGAPQAVVVTEPLLDGDAQALVRLAAALPPGCARSVLVRPDYQGTPALASADRLGFRTLFAPLVPTDLLACLAPASNGTPATSPPATPLQPPPTASAPGDTDIDAQSGVTDGPRPRVLVVEDNPVNRLIAREMLAMLGVSVEEVDSGEAAIEACLYRPPDLVLLDIQMPGLDGLQTARQLRALQTEGRLPYFPLVALTAHALPGDRDTSLAAGMDDHLTKPIRLEHLQQAVARHLPSVASGTSPG